MPPIQKVVQVAEEAVVQQPHELPQTQLFINLRSRSSIIPGSQEVFASAECQVRIDSVTQWYKVLQCDPPLQLNRELGRSNSWWFLGPPQTAKRDYGLYWSDVRYYANHLPLETKTEKINIIYEPTGRPDPSIIFS